MDILGCFIKFDGILGILKKFLIDLMACVKFFVLMLLLAEVGFMILTGGDVSFIVRLLYCVVVVIEGLFLFLGFYYPKYKRIFFCGAICFFIIENVMSLYCSELRWHFEYEICVDVDGDWNDELKVCEIKK
ncbi:MAG: hypothetical protein IKW39_03210 [Alphaproteobacteria bacterium]|nr:hypothetical protein [Alphaproteobacteria bacterium]